MQTISSYSHLSVYRYAVPVRECSIAHSPLCFPKLLHSNGILHLMMEMLYFLFLGSPLQVGTNPCNRGSNNLLQLPTISHLEITGRNSAHHDVKSSFTMFGGGPTFHVKTWLELRIQVSCRKHNHNRWHTLVLKYTSGKPDRICIPKAVLEMASWVVTPMLCICRNIRFVWHPYNQV